MTKYFQLLNLTVNQSCKSFLHDKVQIWYAEQLQTQISKGIAPESVFVDLKIRILKHIHSKWVTQYYNHICIDEDIIRNGWCRSGISKVI